MLFFKERQLPPGVMRPYWRRMEFRYGNKDNWLDWFHNLTETLLLMLDWGPKKRAWLKAKSEQLWVWRMKRQTEKLLEMPRGWDLHMACFKAELEHDHRKLQRELYISAYEPYVPKTSVEAQIRSIARIGNPLTDVRGLPILTVEP